MDRRLVAVGLLVGLAFLGAGFAVDGTNPPDGSGNTAVDLLQGENGTWHVLALGNEETSSTVADAIRLDRVLIYHYDSDWNALGRTALERRAKDEHVHATTFWRTERGTWWVGDGAANWSYEFAADGSLTGAMGPGTAPPETVEHTDKFRGSAADAGLDVDLEATTTYTRYPGGETVTEPVARGAGGDWYLLDRGGAVYRYTSYGQFTGQVVGVAGEHPSPLFDDIWIYVLVTAGLLTLVATVGAWAYPAWASTYVGVGTSSLVSATAIFSYALPWPLSLVYLIPDWGLAAVLLAPVAVAARLRDFISLGRVVVLLVLTTPSLIAVYGLYLAA